MPPEAMDAARCVGAFAVKEFLGRHERFHSDANRTKKILQRVTHRRIIVDDEYDGLVRSGTGRRGVHDASSRPVGRVN